MAMMQREEKKLSAAFLKTDLTPGKYHDGGNIGPYVRVEPNGKRFWVQRVTVNGKRAEIGLGRFPMVGLADARAKATANKRLAIAGGDPLNAKRQAKQSLTFEQAMLKYLEKEGPEFATDKDRKRWQAAFEIRAIPTLGVKLIGAIELEHILHVLEPIWESKTETAKRLRARIEAVLSWATVTGYRKGDNPARWGGNLAELLAKPSKVSNKKNFPAVALGDVPRWWSDLGTRDGMGARALQFLTLCASRSGEVRGMTWDEVDFGEGVGANRANHANQGALWIVPASRMKMKREHRVPLTAEAVALLKSLPRREGSPLCVFRSSGRAAVRYEHISRHAPNAGIRSDCGPGWLAGPPFKTPRRAAWVTINLPQLGSLKGNRPRHGGNGAGA